MMINSPVSSDAESDGELKEPAKSGGSEDERSPVYGPQRSRFDSETASKYGLIELEQTPEPPSPPDVVMDSAVDDKDEKKEDEDSGLPPYYPGIDGTSFLLCISLTERFNILRRQYSFQSGLWIDRSLRLIDWLVDW